MKKLTVILTLLAFAGLMAFASPAPAKSLKPVRQATTGQTDVGRPPCGFDVSPQAKASNRIAGRVQRPGMMDKNPDNHIGSRSLFSIIKSYILRWLDIDTTTDPEMPQLDSIGNKWTRRFVLIKDHGGDSVDL